MFYSSTKEKYVIYQSNKKLNNISIVPYFFLTLALHNVSIKINKAFSPPVNAMCQRRKEVLSDTSHFYNVLRKYNGWIIQFKDKVIRLVFILFSG